VINACSARFASGLNVITFTREMPTSRRADACYRKMSEEVGARDAFFGRARYFM
jgi:4-cresol dehydrogenase (hydroxylating) flavoprotein subunit